MNYLEKLKTYLGNDSPKTGAYLVGLLLIIAGFLAYNNFSKPAPVKENMKIESAENESGGSVAGGTTGPSINKVDFSGTIAGISSSGGNDENKVSIEPVVSNEWMARNLERNSIKDASYTVQKGDTLWEIAEAKYGSGFEWTKILSANKDKVGFLPNGNQALIEVGQELSLP